VREGPNAGTASKSGTDRWKKGFSHVELPLRSLQEEVSPAVKTAAVAKNVEKGGAELFGEFNRLQSVLRNRKILRGAWQQPKRREGLKGKMPAAVVPWKVRSFGSETVERSVGAEPLSGLYLGVSRGASQ